MREHLCVILALLLDVDNENLLNPEAPLYKVVPLEKAVSLTEGPAFPDAVQVKPKVGMVHYVLLKVSQSARRYCKSTYHAERPRYSIVDDQPCLLLESFKAFLRPNTSQPCQWFQHVVHHSDSKACKGYRPEYDVRQIVGAASIHAGLSVVVGHGEEFGGSISRAREEDVREEEQ
jgi:hypothetical protein